MPKVTWVLGNGKEITAEVPVGHNMMEAAVAHNVPDVIGECGGCLSCATCHVFVDPAWFAKTGGPSEMESDMLEITMVDRQEGAAEAFAAAGHRFRALFSAEELLRR